MSNIDSLDDIKNLQDLVTYICKYSRMFGAFTSLEPIGMFIEGFAAGRGGDLREELAKFREWFAEEAYRLYNIPHDRNWWVSLLQIYQNVDTAAIGLPGIYLIYRYGGKLQRVGPARHHDVLKDLHQVASICEKPEMYTMNGTFSEVCSWLTAYAAGVRDLDPEAARRWYAFTDWLVKRLQFPGNYFWSAALREAYSDDETRLLQLRLLSAEYDKSVR